MAVVNIYRTKRCYATILADPPWQYARNQTVSKGERSMFDRQLPYTSMSTADVCALPVERLAQVDAMLWLWVTNALLPDGLRVMKEWGFKFVGVRTWVKPKVGIGYWLRGQTEQLLLGVCGKPNRQRHYNPAAVNCGISTLLAAPAGKHSAKPPESYRDIERQSKPPRIELFARRAHKGWDSWGQEAKEIDKMLERDVKRYL